MDGVTYEVSRAETGWPKGLRDSYSIENAVSIGAFSTPVTVNTADYGQAKIVYFDEGTDLTVRKSYLYKVVPIRNGVRGNPTYKAVNQGIYSTQSYLSGSRDSSYYKVGITLSDTGTYWGDNPVIKVYRRELRGSYVYLTGKDITATAFTTVVADNGSYLFVDDTATPGTTYEYKFVVTLGTTEFENREYNYSDEKWYPKNAEITVQARSAPSITSVGVITPSESTNKTTLVLSFSYDQWYGYKRAPVTVQYKTTSVTTWTTRTGNIDDQGEYSLTGLTAGTYYDIRVQRTSDPDDGYITSSGYTNP
jgi:hypothetical protein